MKLPFNDAGKKVFIFIGDNPSTVITDVAVLPVPNPWYTNNPLKGDSSDKYPLTNNWYEFFTLGSSLSSIILS